MLQSKIWIQLFIKFQLITWAACDTWIPKGDINPFCLIWGTLTGTAQPGGMGGWSPPSAPSFFQAIVRFNSSVFFSSQIQTKAHYIKGRTASWLKEDLQTADLQIVAGKVKKKIVGLKFSPPATKNPCLTYLGVKTSICGFHVTPWLGWRAKHICFSFDKYVFLSFKLKYCKYWREIPLFLAFHMTSSKS